MLYHQALHKFSSENKSVTMLTLNGLQVVPKKLKSITNEYPAARGDLKAFEKRGQCKMRLYTKELHNVVF